MRFFHSKISSKAEQGKIIKIPKKQEDEWQSGDSVRVVSLDDMLLEDMKNEHDNTR